VESLNVDMVETDFFFDSDPHPIIDNRINEIIIFFIFSSLLGGLKIVFKVRFTISCRT
jgi:hypothetical protein